MSKSDNFKSRLSYMKKILELENNYYKLLFHVINNLKINKDYRRKLKTDYMNLQKRRNLAIIHMIRKP